MEELFAQRTQDELVSYEGKGHILYIEDHMTLAKITIEMLKEIGLTIERFTNAESALSAFDENNYDLILLDIVLLGKQDGIGVIDNIRARPDEKKLIPILAISALLNDSQRIYALKVGVNDFINKLLRALA